MTSLYRLCFTFLLLIASSFIGITKADNIQLTAHQIQQKHSGLIGDRNSYIFSLNAFESMLIEVTQPNTDLKLRITQLNNDETEDLIFESSIPATTWLAEKVIINANQCTLCKIQILPIDERHNSGNYTLTSEYVSANTQIQYRRFLTLMTTASVQWFNAQQKHNAINSAIDTYQNIASAAKDGPYIDIYLFALYYQSQLDHLIGNNPQQEQLLLEILARSSPQVDAVTMRALLDLGSIARSNDDYDNAMLYFDKAFDLAEKNNHLLIQAKIKEKRSLIESDKGSYAEAISLSEQANQAYIAEGDWHSIIKNLIATGWFYYRYGKPELALNHYQKALSYATKTSLVEQKVDVLTKIGTVYRHLGDLEQASHFTNQALLQSGEISHSLVDGWSKQAKARILMDAGMFELAEDWLNLSLAAFNKASSTNDIFNIYYFLGINHDNRGNYQIAEKYHQMVLAFDKKNDNSYDIGSTYYRLAQNALSQQNHAKAQVYQQQALHYLASTDDMNLLGNLYSQAAYISFNNKNTAKTDRYFEQALSLQAKNNDTIGLIQTYYWLAKTQADKGKSKLALKAIIEATNNIQSVQEKLSREDFKANFFSLQQQVSGLHIELLNKQNYPPVDTLNIAESFRSQALNAKLNHAKQTHIIPFEYKTKQHALYQKLQSSIIKHEHLNSPIARTQIARETRLIAEQLQELYLKSSSMPNSTQQEKPYQHDMLAMQHHLTLDSVILYFDTNEINSHLWLITHKKISYYPLPSEADLLAQVIRVIDTINKPKQQLSSQNISTRQPVIKQLSNTLLGDISVELAQAHHITVIPDGPLHYLPFSILSLETSQRRLIEQASISYAPSLSVLQQLNDKSRLTQSNNILLVANPAMTNIKETVGKKSNYRLGFYSKELPYTQLEANYIQSMAQDNVTTLARHHATKAALHDVALNNFQILHFATHGIANSYQPSLGGLVLSNASTSDNLLLSPEIINFRLNADLVVLSGCETAAGKMINGEGVFSLSRSFFAAGTKRVIASLWPVQDDATAKLMQSFYRHLLIEKLPIEVALQQAKLYVKNFERKNHQKPWKDPYYWAGFVLQGPGGNFID